MWPWCGGSKLPPKRATRMAILPAECTCNKLRKVEDETHADLFDGVVVAVRAEGIQAAVAELGHSPVQNREQFDIETGKPLVLEIVVDDVRQRLTGGWAAGIQAVVAAAKASRDLEVRFQGLDRCLKGTADAAQ